MVVCVSKYLHSLFVVAGRCLLSMKFRLKYFFVPFLLLILSSCFLKKKDKYSNQEPYSATSGINSHQSPQEIAKEIGETSKRQKKAYLKQLKRTKRQMDKRNRQKQKNIIIKTKTKKVRGSKNNTKSDTKKAPGKDTKNSGDSPREK